MPAFANKADIRDAATKQKPPNDVGGFQFLLSKIASVLRAGRSFADQIADAKVDAHKHLAHILCGVDTQ